MIIFIPILALLLGIGLCQKVSSYSNAELGLFIWNGLWTICLIFFIIWLFGTRFTTATYPDKRQALQETYEKSRQENFSEFERATITKDIAEFNENLAIDKYWNKTWYFDWFVNDKVENIKPIK